MSDSTTYCVTPVGFVRSTLKERADAPRQGKEGAPNAWVEVTPDAAEALLGISPGDEIILITWLHKARRDVLRVHPRSEVHRPLAGVFATRSPDRPNPLGLHRVRVLQLDSNKVEVGPLEAIDGTPIVDIKPVLVESPDG